MIHLRTYFLLCTLLAPLPEYNAARILGIFPIGVRSHFSYNRAIMESLHKAGHQITIITSYSDAKSTENFTVVALREELKEFRFRPSIKDFIKIPMSTFVELGIQMLGRDLDDLLKLKEIQDILKTPKNQYDLIVYEFSAKFDVCYKTLSSKLGGIPMIETLPVRTDIIINTDRGNHNHPAYVPSGFTYASQRMNFYRRIENTFYYLYMQYVAATIETHPKWKDIQQKCDSKNDSPPRHSSSLVFQNSHPMFLSKPMVPSVIEIGGIHIKPRTPLPRNIEQFIDEAEHGVILMSFGFLNQGAAMDEDMKTYFKRAFAEIPQRVIWKYEDDIEGLSCNVLVMDRIPQRDILAHKNVKAFITHCGVNGMYEAIYEGVPMVMTPFFGDQLANAAALEELGAGVHLDISSVRTYDVILDSLNRVVDNSSYKENVRKLSQIFKDTLMSPQESVVYWTEYVLKHGGASHMKTTAADMPFYQFLLLDVVTFVFVVTISVFYIFAYLLKKFLGLCIRGRKNTAFERNKKLK